MMNSGQFTKEISGKIKEKIASAQSPKLKAVDEAFRIFSLAFDEYAKKHQLDEKQISVFKEILHRAFVERKATAYAEEKFADINDYLQVSLENAIKTSFRAEPINTAEITRVFYINEKNKMFKNLL